MTAAGISGKIDAVDYPADTFRRILDVNVMGTFLVVQAAVRVIQREKVGGSVVLIASMSGSVANKVRSSSSPFSYLPPRDCLDSNLKTIATTNTC